MPATEAGSPLSLANLEQEKLSSAGFVGTPPRVWGCDCPYKEQRKLKPWVGFFKQPLPKHPSHWDSVSPLCGKYLPRFLCMGEAGCAYEHTLMSEQGAAVHLSS